MNWGEFKRICESRGVTDATEIKEINLYGSPCAEQVDIGFGAMSGALIVSQMGAEDVL